MDSLELIVLLRSNKEKGISCLYDKYASALNGIIVRIVQSEKIAEEVLQKTFLKIIATIDEFDAQTSSLFTWMSRMARQEALEASRATGTTRSNFSLTDEPDKSLLSISSECKEVLDHIYVLGYTPLETSEKLGIPLDTVKIRLRSAIQQLKQSIPYSQHSYISKALLILFSISILS